MRLAINGLFYGTNIKTSLIPKGTCLESLKWIITWR
jgi:hypothetical protein